jgi:two-component system chemotaxis response regulator CheB
VTGYAGQVPAPSDSRDGATAPAFDVVVIVASLGGPEAIREVLSSLTADFPSAFLVVQHRTPRAQDLTVELLRRRVPLTTRLATEGDLPRPSTVYVMPVDRELVLGADGALTVLAGRQRPGRFAVPLVASVARHYGPRAIGMVLSGSNDDGAAGMVALKRSGGRILAQDRASARCFTMPAAAIATGCVDLVLPVTRLGPALVSLVLWPGAAELLRVPLPPWARLDPGLPLSAPSSL